MTNNRESCVIEFGALSPELVEQGWEDPDGHLQKDADAITRLLVRGVLTAVEANHARNRLVKKIAKAQPK